MADAERSLETPWLIGVRRSGKRTFANQRLNYHFSIQIELKHKIPYRSARRMSDDRDTGYFHPSME